MFKKSKVISVLLVFVLILNLILPMNVLAADTVPPSAPTNVTCVSKTSSTVTLTWTASTDDMGVTGYEVYKSQTLMGSTTGETTCTISELRDNTSYTFTVKAKDSAGNLSLNSNEVTVVTNKFDNVPPTTPSNLVCDSVNATTATLSWTASTDNIGVTGYKIYSGTDLIDSIGGDITTYKATQLMANTSYTFTVKAIDAESNLSAASNTVNVTTLDISKYSEIYSYDALDRLTGVTYENGEVGEYTYDAQGNILNSNVVQSQQLLNKSILNETVTNETNPNMLTSKSFSNIKLSSSLPLNTSDISAGRHISSSVTADGDLYTWGHQGDYGYAETYFKSPTYVMSNVSEASSGCEYVVARTNDGKLYGWGGEVIIWGWPYAVYPPVISDTPILLADNVVSVSAGFSHFAYIKTDGSLWFQGFIQLQNNSYSYWPDGVQKLDNVKSVSAGVDYTMAVKNDGSLWAWGRNNFGQLGDGTTVDKFSPVKIMDGVDSVSAGNNFTMVIKSDGSLWSWGNNEYGKLGNRSTKNSLIPVKILDGVKSIELGYDHSTAIKTDGSLWAWGWNGYGQLGDGEINPEEHSPIKIMDDVSKVSAGDGYTMAIKTDGSLWSWGCNSCNELGDGTDTFQSYPVRVSYLPKAENTGLGLYSITLNRMINSYNRLLEDSPESFINDPVDTASGAQHIVKNLLSEKGAIDLDFTLQYNSLLLNSGVLGKAWSHNFEGNLTKVDANNITINWGANRQSKYVYDGMYFVSTNTFTPYEKIESDSNGNYILTKQDGLKYTFGSNGTLNKIIDRNNHSIDLSYNTSKQLIKATEPISNSNLYFTYNTNNKLSEVYDDLGREIVFEYDANNDLTSITDANGYKTTYELNYRGQIYDATDSEGRQLFKNEYDSYGRIIAQDDGLDDGKTTTFEYDEVSQPGYIVTTTTDRNGNQKILVHDSNYRLISETDEMGNITKYEYDEKGNKTKVTDAKNNVSTYSYDAKGNLLTSTNSLNQVTTFTYDDKDNLLSIVGADNKAKTFTYNLNNNMLEESDYMGNKTLYNYDVYGMLITKTLPEGGIATYEYDQGRLKKITDSTGVVENYIYDVAGRMIEKSNAAGKKIQYVYDNNDNVLKVTDALGAVTQYTYNGLNNKLTETNANLKTTTYQYDNNGKLISLTDPLTNQIIYAYDPEGRLIEITDALGNKSTNTYDAKGRKVETRDALGNTTKYTYDEVDNLISTTDPLGNVINVNNYDSLGNILSTVDSLGRTTSYQYDVINRLKTTTNPLNNSTQMFYNDNGQLITVENALEDSSSQTYNKNGNIITTTDLNGNATTFTYDSAGRMLSRTNSSQKNLASTYNSLGQLESTVNGRGQITTYTYDDAGRVASKTDPLGTTSYTYDVLGNTSTITDTKGTISYIYDDLNRVTEYTDVNGNVIKYTYDNNGNLITLTYPDNKTVNYTYDEVNRLKTVTDWAGRTTSYTYDKNSRLVLTANADGSKVAYSYDVMGQVLTQTIYNKSSDLIEDYAFTYDNNGNIVTESYITPKGLAKLDSISATYGMGNQITTISGSAISGSAITFDEDGNMTTGLINGTMSTLSYDARNRLISAGGLIYDYDALGNRLSITENENITINVVNPLAQLSQLLMEKDENGTVLSYYVYGIGLIGMQTADGNYYTYHYDRRGSTIALTDSNGQVTDRYTYGTFGELLNKEGNTRNQFLYNGRDGVVTDANGLYYMRARYYSPDMRRFVNEDTVLGEIGNSQTLNRFAYVNGNPVNLVDPEGNFAWIPMAIGAAVGGGIDLTSQLIQNNGDFGSVNWSSVGKAAVVGGVTAIVPATRLISKIALGSTSNTALAWWKGDINSGTDAAAYAITGGLLGGITSNIGERAYNGAVNKVLSSNTKAIRAFVYSQGKKKGTNAMIKTLRTEKANAQLFKDAFGNYSGIGENASNFPLSVGGNLTETQQKYLSAELWKYLSQSLSSSSSFSYK